MKILIADDEALVRQSIVLFLKDLGVDQEDILEADNGLSMVEKLDQRHFDLAIVDIRMPSMNGLEAIRSARKTSPDTDFYVLSGFDDFKYAQEAIRLGVKDYLLKPLTRRAMELILDSTISSLERKQTQLIETLRLNIVSLLNQPDHPMVLPHLCHPLLLVNDIAGRVLSLSEFLEKNDEKILMIPYGTETGSLLFLFETSEYPGYYQEMKKTLARFFLPGYTIVEGKPFTVSDQWNTDYSRMKKLAACRPVYGPCRLYKSNCRPPALDPEVEELCTQCCKTLSAFSRADHVEFSIICDTIIQKLPQTEEKNPESARRILSFLTDAYQTEPLSGDNIKQQLLKAASVIMQIPSARDFKYEEITAYLKTHYMEDLTLTGVAALYGLSPNYFSTLFKKMSGSNFISWLTKLRIEKAKRLLMETDLTIRDIAGQVGYYSTSFFIRSFKKIEGRTPSEYRKSLSLR